MSDFASVSQRARDSAPRALDYRRASTPAPLIQINAALPAQHCSCGHDARDLVACSLGYGWVIILVTRWRPRQTSPSDLSFLN